MGNTWSRLTLSGCCSSFGISSIDLGRGRSFLSKQKRTNLFYANTPVLCPCRWHEKPSEHATHMFFDISSQEVSLHKVSNPVKQKQTAPRTPYRTNEAQDAQREYDTYFSTGDLVRLAPPRPRPKPRSLGPERPRPGGLPPPRSALPPPRLRPPPQWLPENPPSWPEIEMVPSFKLNNTHCSSRSVHEAMFCPCIKPVLLHPTQPDPPNLSRRRAGFAAPLVPPIPSHSSTLRFIPSHPITLLTQPPPLPSLQPHQTSPLHPVPCPLSLNTRPPILALYLCAQPAPGPVPLPSGPTPLPHHCPSSLPSPPPASRTFALGLALVLLRLASRPHVVDSRRVVHRHHHRVFVRRDVGLLRPRVLFGRRRRLKPEAREIHKGRRTTANSILIGPCFLQRINMTNGWASDPVWKLRCTFHEQTEVT